MSNFQKKYENYKHIIKGIQFVTATPYDEFWNILTKNKINKLLNYLIT